MNGNPAAGFDQSQAQLLTGEFSSGVNNVYSSTGVAKPMAGEIQVGSMDGYKPADFAQPPKSQKRPLRRIVRRVLAILLIILLILTTAEELLVGLFRGRTLADSLAHVVGPTFFQGFAVSFVMFLILMPYSGFMCLSEVLGEGKLVRLFFVERPPARTGGWPDSGQQHENVSR